jgi:hypothetical protein
MFTTGLYFTVFLSSCYIIISMLAPWFLLEEYLQIVASGTQGFFFFEKRTQELLCSGNTLALAWPDG